MEHGASGSRMRSGKDKDRFMSEKSPADNFPAGYEPPKVWTWEQGNGGAFANINRPVAGPTHDKDRPVGKHPLQLYSLATPNGVLKIQRQTMPTATTDVTTGRKNSARNRTIPRNCSLASSASASPTAMANGT